MEPNQPKFFILCLIGILLSVYALFVELNKEHDQNYQAMCDISEQMSCSKVLSSKWGRGFGIFHFIVGEHSIFNQPNSMTGIIFYTTLAFLNFSWNPLVAKLQLGLSIISNIVSLYLASILIFVLKDFCVVCVTTYFVNACILVLSIRKLRFITSLTKAKSKSN